MDGLKDHLIRILPHWHYKIERSIKQKQKNKNISYETYFCLLTLEKYGDLTMSEVAKHLRLSKQQATQMIDRLYGYQLIERKEGSNDRRSIHICLSNQGILFLKENPLDLTALQEQITTHLSQAEQEEFNNAITVLLRLLQKWD